MNKRPTLDDLQREQANFIGPPKEPRGPKFARELTRSEELYVECVVAIHCFRAAIEADQPIDAARVPEQLAKELEAHCAGRVMPIIDGRPHYPAMDVLKVIAKLS